MQQGSNAGANGAATATLTDEQILGLEPVPANTPAGESAVAQVFPSRPGRDGGPEVSLDSSPENPRVPPTRNVGEDPSYSNDERRDAGAGSATASEPAWLKSLEASAIPNGGEAAAEARRWRQAALDAAALDTDYFSAEPGARAALAARLHQTDPAAFRGMLADAARILAERDPQGLAELARRLGAPSDGPKSIARAARNPLGSPDKRRREDPSYSNAPAADDDVVAQVFPARPSRDGGPEASPASSAAPTFPAEAYRAFEAATNNDVARQVRDAIDRTLTATLPDGVADGARRRIGEDIFRDLSSTLSGDRGLSGQINELLRGWRFDAATRQQLAGLLTGRARVALPEVARRVVSEWTSSVLASDRAKNARIESAASRRDITGGRLPEPVASSALRPRRVDYGRTSDEQILEM